MIDVKELRIGNLVRVETYDIDYEGNKYTDWDYVTVRSISSDGINLFISNQHIEPDDFVADIQGIPLNEEWLLKCGGVKCKGTPFYEIDLGGNIGQLNINPNNGMVWIRHHRFPEEEGLSINPMTGDKYYLHQLQNVYHALTGKELEYKQ